MSNLSYHVFPNETFVDLGIYQYGWERCDSLHSYGPYIRNHYLFHYVISGMGKLLSNDAKGIEHSYEIKSGQGFLICPKQINTYIADMEHPWEYVWFEFDGLRAKEALNLAGLSINSPLYLSNNKELSGQLKNEMLYISQHSSESPINLIGHLYLALDYLTRSSASRNVMQNGRFVDFYIREAISYIEQNFQNDITIEDIAQYCNLNRSYFGKIFRNVVNKSPQEFLINYRMTKAAELLKYSEIPIHDISLAVGYNNQLHFSRAFKNMYQISPREWRNKNKIQMDT